MSSHQDEEIDLPRQDETVSIDQLTDSIKRASELLESCNSRLTSTEQKVNSVIKKLGLGD